MAGNGDSPAFPLVATGYDGVKYEPEFGMTLRDWFAGQALAGMVAKGVSAETVKPVEIAKAAYAIAHAMIDERAQPNPREGLR